jgi:NADH-quinone oxidoreductase subunit E
VLSPEERAEIDEELERVPTRRAACIEALRAVQRRRGWVDDDALRAVAEYLEMSVHELDGVASFYNLIYRRPVGRHVLLLCDSVSCFIMGADGLRAAIRTATGADYGQTSADRRFTVLPIACLGSCERAPALMVDEDLHTDVTLAGLPELLARYR